MRCYRLGGREDPKKNSNSITPQEEISKRKNLRVQCLTLGQSKTEIQGFPFQGRLCDTQEVSGNLQVSQGPSATCSVFWGIQSVRLNILQGSFLHQLLEVTGEKLRLSNYRKKDQECIMTKCLIFLISFTSLENMLFVVIGDLLGFLNWGSVKN